MVLASADTRRLEGVAVVSSRPNGNVNCRTHSSLDGRRAACAKPSRTTEEKRILMTSPVQGLCISTCLRTFQLIASTDRVVEQLPEKHRAALEHATRKKQSERVVEHTIEEADPPNAQLTDPVVEDSELFETVPDACRRNCISNFIDSTGNSATRTLVCAVRRSLLRQGSTRHTGDQPGRQERPGACAISSRTRPYSWNVAPRHTRRSLRG